MKIDKIEPLLIFASATLTAVAILNRTSFNQLTTISFLVLVGLCFRLASVSSLLRNFESITIHREFDGVFILAALTFLYSLSIYLLSRFIGPIYGPMYAADKSMFAVFGQFSWLLIMLITIGSNSQMRFTRIVRRFTLVAALFLVLGLANFIRYDELQKQWWHEPTLVALNENPDALIACVNSILTTDYESYKCNHFMNVLTKHSYSARSLAGVSLGDSPVRIAITDWFKGTGPTNAGKFNDDTKVIVLSQDELGAGALSLFEGVSKNMIEFRVVNP